MGMSTYNMKNVLIVIRDLIDMADGPVENPRKLTREELEKLVNEIYSIVEEALEKGVPA